jgi:hypothetical protein
MIPPKADPQSLALCMACGKDGLRETIMELNGSKPKLDFLPTPSLVIDRNQPIPDLLACLRFRSECKKACGKDPRRLAELLLEFSTKHPTEWWHSHWQYEYVAWLLLGNAGGDFNERKRSAMLFFKEYWKGVRDDSVSTERTRARYAAAELNYIVEDAHGLTYQRYRLFIQWLKGTASRKKMSPGDARWVEWAAQCYLLDRPNCNLSKETLRDIASAFSTCYQRLRRSLIAIGRHERTRSTASNQKRHPAKPRSKRGATSQRQKRENALNGIDPSKVVLEFAAQKWGVSSSLVADERAKINKQMPGVDEESLGFYASQCLASHQNT